MHEIAAWLLGQAAIERKVPQIAKGYLAHERIGKGVSLMDYVKEAENYLRHYASLKKSVEHAEYMIHRLTYRSQPKEISAAKNDMTGVAVQYSGNTLQEMYELQKWQEVCEKSAGEIEHIESLLNGLEPKEQRILQMWYLEKLDKFKIAIELGCSERNVFYLKGKAVRNFAINLFGILALKAL